MCLMHFSLQAAEEIRVWQIGHTSWYGPERLRWTESYPAAGERHRVSNWRVAK